MTSTRPLVTVLSPAAFTVLYIADKIHLALEGRLGVHGGPTVTTTEQENYTDIAQIGEAQWANAAAGILILAVVLLPILPATRRWQSFGLAISLILLGSALTVFGIFMLIGSLQSERGGHLFGIYCVFWGLSILPLAARLRASQRFRRRIAHSETTGERITS